MMRLEGVNSFDASRMTVSRRDERRGEGSRDRCAMQGLNGL